MKEKIYKIAPHFFQNLMISIFNYFAYKKRYGGIYNNFLETLINNHNLSLENLKKIQENEFNKLLKHATNNSFFYKDKYRNISIPNKIDEISKLPIISKEEIRKNIENVYTIKKKKGEISKTGGTTGKSLEIIFTLEDLQKGFAFLDYFRGWYGYQLGKKTAWFSGKALLTTRDLKKNRFWKTDYLYKVRYYSTFHIYQQNLKYYMQDLIRFNPEYLSGFPTSIVEIARYGLDNNIKYPGNIKAIFLTSETVTDEIKNDLERFFKTKIANQYASSEGAPLIYECPEGNLHLELQSGIFEVLDNNNKPAKEGRLVVTSFLTYGTPLIRYDIKDSIQLSNKTNCACGNNNPIAEKILGRMDDFVYSPFTGKINLVNIANTLKDVKGIVKFQVLQESLHEITIKIITDDKYYNKKYEKVFLKNWKDRLGEEFEIILQEVSEIPVEKSGKFRLVKNNIKHLIQ